MAVLNEVGAHAGVEVGPQGVETVVDQLVVHRGQDRAAIPRAVTQPRVAEVEAHQKDEMSKLTGGMNIPGLDKMFGG